MNNQFRFLLINVFIIFLLNSCIVGTIEDYEQTSVYEFSINSSEIKHVKTFGLNESDPFFMYFHNSNKKLISQYYSFYIIDESGNEEQIKSDVFISDKFYFDISPNNQEVIFSGFIPNGSTLINIDLYRLDLNTKEISLLRSDSSVNICYPSYANSGNQILFIEKGVGVGQEVGSKIVIMDLVTNKLVTIDSNNYRSIHYARFSKNDSQIYYFDSPDEIYQYDLNSHEKTSFVSNQNFTINYNFTSGFPLFNLSESSLYFCAGDGTNGRYPPYYIFEQNVLSDSAEMLFSGYQPMSITNNYLLYRENVCSTCGVFNPSNIKLINRTNYTDSITISPGNYGTISNDERFVLFSWIKTKMY